MKTKPTLIITAIAIVLIVCVIFLVRSKKGGYIARKSEITQFLNGFNNSIKEGNTDSLLTYFDASKKRKVLKKLVNLLAGKNSLDGKGKSLFGLSFDIDNSDVKFVTKSSVEATLPASFMHDSLSTWKTSLTLKIRKVSAHRYKIVQVDARRFLADFASYENLVRTKTIPDKDIYDAITLAAFKTAEQLKVRYDSVLWFDHINNQTYFYVITGKLNFNFYDRDDLKEDEKQTYYMGLVNPELKEIIPPKYDLIHNVSGTIDGLIEVEKDGKKGFYNLNGKIMVPVIYSQIIPINDDENLALLKDDNDYFYLKKDSTVSDKISNFKLAAMLPKFKTYGESYTLTEKSSKNTLEFNSREDFSSLVVPPSYLVDMQILPKFIMLHNPLRHMPNNGEEDGRKKLVIKYNGSKKEDRSWFTSIYYSVMDHFLDGREDIYQSNETRKLLLVDEKQNKILGFDADNFISDEGEDDKSYAKCNENYFRSVNDTLFEFRTTGLTAQRLFKANSAIVEAPVYYYLHITNGKLTALPNKRVFGCTKYIKMDDSYLEGCFVIADNNENKTFDRMTPDILQYMKNEIYASYNYKFKNNTWNDIFSYSFNRLGGSLNASVDDSLTEIDKYNINWISQKLNALKAKPNTLASR
ncbi:MAG TPA: WG repeat-containing protein [Mucilaginibacter sp.]|jgi:hypothetical protein|nr:WG repeat-containing protein [Mucilaginibacter sp.]